MWLRGADTVVSKAGMSGSPRPRILAITNPTSGGGAGGGVADRLVTLARRGGLELTLRRTTGPGDATAIARDAGGGFDVVCAVGGDGTLHEVANGLLAIPAEARPALAVLPVGTGNDLARALGIPPRIDEAFPLLAAGARRPLDAVRVGDRWFVNNLAVGFGAEIVRDMARSRRLRRFVGGHLAYFAFSLRRIPHRSLPLSVHAAGRTFRGSYFEVHLANGPYCGGGVSFAPDADPSDGLIDLALFAPQPLWDTVKMLLRVQKGERVDGPCVERLRVPRVTIESADPMCWYLDGESHASDGPTTLTCEVSAGALEVIVPA
jgi:YegS/Rv2252/BmrU family lipid kinase